MIEPSQARYRTAVAMQRLANALGVELDPSRDNCECLERLADKAELLHPNDTCRECGKEPDECGSCSAMLCDCDAQDHECSREEIADERTADDVRNGIE